jgi:hypothetical protein
MSPWKMRRRELAGLILAGLILAVSPTWGRSGAPADTPTRYAVLPFVFSPPHRDLQWLTEAFALSVADRLDLLGFTVASRRERAEVAQSAGIASPSPLTLASRLKLARAMRSERAVTGTLAFEPSKEDDPAAGQLVVTVVVIDLATDRFLHKRTLRGTMNELFSMMDEVALEVAWQDPAPPGPEARPVIKKLADPPLPALEAVMRAIVEFDPDRQAILLEAAQGGARDHPILQRRLGDCLIESGRVDEGLAKLRSIDPATQPDPWRLHFDLAEILLARGEVDEAARSAALSVTARDTAPAHLLLARVALLRSDSALAAQEAKLAASLDPAHPALPSLLRQIGPR